MSPPATNKKQEKRSTVEGIKEVVEVASMSSQVRAETV
jgi:hypothetical protein